jgi:predicted phage-related endonuclease
MRMTTATPQAEPAQLSAHAARAKVLFERASDLATRGVEQQMARWATHPKTVGKARKNWPLYMGAVLVAREYCGVTSPAAAAEALKEALEHKVNEKEVAQLLGGEIPDLWQTSVFRTRFRQHLPEGALTQLERVSLRFMDITGMNDAAVAACRKRGSFGAGGRDQHWLGCILKETPGYAEAIEDMSVADLMNVCYHLRKTVWEPEDTIEATQVLAGELPKRWMELAPPEGLAERPPRWDTGEDSAEATGTAADGGEGEDVPPPPEVEHDTATTPPPEPPPPATPPAEYLAPRDTTLKDWANPPTEEEAPFPPPEPAKRAHLSAGPAVVGPAPGGLAPFVPPVASSGPVIFRDDPIPEIPQLTEEQLALRRQGITATDISAIMNLNPWRTPLDIFIEKTEGPETWEPELRQLIGLVVEKPVLRLYLTDYPAQEVKRYVTVQNPKRSFELATPDATADDRLVEVKTTGYLWDDVPIYYVAQVHWQWGVLRDCGVDLRSVVHVPTLSATYMGFQLDVWEVEIDLDYLAKLREAAEFFWMRHVQAGVPPEVVAADIATIKRRYPVWDPRADLLVADEEAERLYTLLPEFLEEREIASQAVDKIFAKLQARVARAPGIVFEDGHKISWKNNAPTEKTSWKPAFEDLQHLLVKAGVDFQLINTAAIEAREQNTQTIPGPRVWRSEWKKLIPADLR